MKNYFNTIPSPRKERVLAFYFILLPMLILVMLASLFSSCSSAGPVCHTYDHSVQHDNTKAVKKQIHAQSNYRAHKAKN